MSAAKIQKAADEKAAKEHQAAAKKIDVVELSDSVSIIQQSVKDQKYQSERAWSDMQIRLDTIEQKTDKSQQSIADLIEEMQIARRESSNPLDPTLSEKEEKEKDSVSVLGEHSEGSDEPRKGLEDSRRRLFAGVGDDDDDDLAGDSKLYIAPTVSKIKTSAGGGRNNSKPTSRRQSTLVDIMDTKMGITSMSRWGIMYSDQPTLEKLNWWALAKFFRLGTEWALLHDCEITLVLYVSSKIKNDLLPRCNMNEADFMALSNKKLEEILLKYCETFLVKDQVHDRIKKGPGKFDLTTKTGSFGPSDDKRVFYDALNVFIVDFEAFYDLMHRACIVQGVRQFMPSLTSRRQFHMILAASCIGLRWC